ncbi:MAG TPA: hypothetical protein VNA22_03495, partial [Pyrinomonadaceae bacterium]|nr:hypothetical protein [Pyrinomonadaceae bacterium]
MKRCPQCRRDYHDETLLFCLDDGAALLDGPTSVEEPATALMSVEEKTRVLDGASSAAQVSPPRRRSLMAVIVGGVAIAVLAIGSYLHYARPGV